MKTYDLYGIDETDGETTRHLVTELLKIDFQLHESSYWGEYFRSKWEGNSYRIISNFHDGVWQEEDHKNFTWLLEVNDVEHPHAIFDAVATAASSIVFLHRTEVEEKISSCRYVYRDGEFHAIARSVASSK